MAKIHSLSTPLTALELYLGKNDFVRPDGTSFWDFLSKNDIPYTKKQFGFLTRNNPPRIKSVFSWKEYCALSSKGTALAYFYQGFKQGLEYVGAVLDTELIHGFNDHTDRHTLWVSQEIVELLQRAGMSYDGYRGFDRETELLAVAAGMTHDIGNFLGRKDHWRMSGWMISRLFRDTNYYPRAWDALMEAVILHEEPEILRLGVDITKTSPLHWALIVADKMHVGRDRLGSRSFTSELAEFAFEDDAHILVNALIVRSSWRLGVKKFIWNIDFSVDQLEQKFEPFTRGNHRLWMPQSWQDKLLGEGIRYRESFRELFLSIYADRHDVAAQAIFLLFPFVDEFEIRLVDNDTRNKVGSREQTIWSVQRT